MKKQENKITVRDIDATLTYGQIFTGRGWRATLIFFLVWVCLGCIAYVCYVVASIVEKDIDMILLIAPGGVYVILIVLCVFLFSKMLREKKYGSIRLEDAVILKAQAESADQTLHVRGTLMRVATAIEVSFGYDGKRYTRQSTYKDKPLYLAVYTKYAEQRNILIAYSPKYDEVMLIKPKSAERLRENL